MYKIAIATQTQNDMHHVNQVHKHTKKVIPMITTALQLTTISEIESDSPSSHHSCFLENVPSSMSDFEICEPSGDLKKNVHSRPTCVPHVGSYSKKKCTRQLKFSHDNLGMYS